MYLVDANVLIEAHRTYYAPDLAPVFWEWMAEQAEKGTIASVSQVRQELEDGDRQDFLRSWSRSLPADFWREPLVEAAPSYQTIFDWINEAARPYIPAAVSGFFEVADSSLVAQAHARGHEIVTFEKPSPQARKRVLIPDVCDALGVSYCDGFTMYRQLGLRFS